MGRVSEHAHVVSDHRFELRANESPGRRAESDLLLSPYQKVSRSPTCNEERVISLLGLLAGSLWRRLLLGQNKGMCLSDSCAEVRIVRQELVEIDDILIKKSSCDDWGKPFSIAIENCLVDGVTNMLFQLLVLVLCQVRQIDTSWKCNFLLILLVVVIVLDWWLIASHWIATRLLTTHSATHVLCLTDIL